MSIAIRKMLKSEDVDAETPSIYYCSQMVEFAGTSELGRTDILFRQMDFLVIGWVSKVPNLHLS